MHRLVPAVLVLLAGVSSLASLAAQTAQTLALPDPFDLRPTGARLQGRLAELTAEAGFQAANNNPAGAAQLNALVATLRQHQSGALPIPPGSGVEFHVVGFYEGFGATSTTPGTATVVVDRPGSAVVLVLNAYEPITWTLSQTPGTAVIAVASYSYEPQTLTGLQGVPTLQLSYTANSDGTYWGRPNDPSDPESRFRAAIWLLGTGGAFPTTFTGGYTAPAGTHTVGPADAAWRDEWVAAAAARESLVRCGATRANLIAQFQGALFLPLFVPGGILPAAPTLAVASPVQTLLPLPLPVPAGTTAYAIGNQLDVYTLANRTPSRLDLATFASTPIPSPTLPPISFANAMTFDLLRNRLLVSSFGGQGELRAFDVATSTWSVLAQLNNQEPAAIAYSLVHDATFGLRIDAYANAPYELRRYDGSGTLVGAVPLPLPVFDEFLETHQLYSVGTDVVYVGPSRRVFGVSVRHCFVIDPVRGDVRFASVLIG